MFQDSPTEIWMYNLSEWTRSLLLITEHCFITSATLSRDFSTIIYTTVGRDDRKDLASSMEYYETILVDIRIPRNTPRYLIASGKDYERASV